MSRRRDEVTHSEYRNACGKIERLAAGMRQADSDEVVEHYLPQVTRELALVYNFVGANMTGRNVAAYMQSLADLDLAKHGVTSTEEMGRLPEEPTRGGK